MDVSDQKQNPEELVQARSNALWRLFDVSLATTILGQILLGVGIAILCLIDDSKYPVTAGFPVTAGGLGLFSGICGIQASRYIDSKFTDPAAIKQGMCLLGMWYGIGISTMNMTGMAFGHAIASVATCDSVCGNNFNAMLALNSVAIAVAGLQFPLQVMSLFMYCRMRKILPMRGCNCSS